MSIESSLLSSDEVLGGDENTAAKFKAEKIKEIKDQIEINQMIKPKLTKSTTEVNSFLEPVSKLFMLSQLEDTAGGVENVGSENDAGSN